MKRSHSTGKESINYDLCIICQETSSETVQRLTRQGYPALFSSATLKCDDTSNILKKEMMNEDEFMAKIPVYHAQCRRNYNIGYYKSEENVTKVEEKAEVGNLSREKLLLLKDVCFICQKMWDNKGNRKLKLISTLSRQNEIWRQAKDLNDVDMLTKIEGFGDSCVDTIARNFKYHQLCIIRYLNKKVAMTIKSPNVTNFYPFNELKNILVVEQKGVTISWIRKKNHQNALLHNISYDSKYPGSLDITAILKLKYGESIVILERQGLSSVVFLANSIIVKMKKHIVVDDTEAQTDVSDSEGEGETSESDSQQEMFKIPKSPHKTTANIFHTATVIRRDILDKKAEIPTSLTMSNDEATSLIPFRLFNFIAVLLNNQNENDFDAEHRILINKESVKMKVVSLCQDILYCNGIKTPKSIGLALLLLKQRQKFLIEKLNQLGHCISYPDAQRYLQDAAIKADEKVDEVGVFIPSNIENNKFTQFALDNLDFQEKSKDGRTTHGTTHIIYQYLDDTEDTRPTTLLVKHTKKRLKPSQLNMKETSLSKVERETIVWILHIRHTKQSDEGLYECQVCNSPTYSIYVTLELFEVQAVILGPNIKEVDRGFPIRLSCILNTTQQYRIKRPTYMFWYHDNRMINYDLKDGAVVREGRLGTDLIFQRALRVHSGNYSCVPSNAKQASVLVIVHYPGEQLRQYPFKAIKGAARKKIPFLTLLLLAVASCVYR